MSQGSVDWLIQAVSQTDESFEPACLFRPALVKMLWQRVRLLSPVIMKRMKCEEKLWCRGDEIEMKNPDLQNTQYQKDGGINQSYIRYEIDEICRQVKKDKGIKVYKQIA